MPNVNVSPTPTVMSEKSTDWMVPRVGSPSTISVAVATGAGIPPPLFTVVISAISPPLPATWLIVSVPAPSSANVYSPESPA